MLSATQDAIFYTIAGGLETKALANSDGDRGTKGSSFLAAEGVDGESKR